MPKGIQWILGISLLVTGPLSAQSPPPIVEAESPPKHPANPGSTSPVVDFSGKACEPYRIWASSEYLLWWVKGAPVPLPLVTTGDPSVGFAAGINTAGAIGQPGTRVLLGNEDAHFGAISGTRFTIGSWLGNDQVMGIEGSAFLLERSSDRFSARSDGAGNPPLYFPAFNVLSGTERAIPISDPLRGFAGDVSVTSTLDLWGAELNGSLLVTRRPGFQLTMLGGFRYMDLRENLSVQNTTSDLILLNTQVSNDSFSTRNQFYGGQLGARAGWQRDRLSLDVTAKIALGVNHEMTHIQGESSETALPGGFAIASGSSVGGIYAQSSNIGHFNSNQFSVLPTVETKIGYQFTQRLRAFAGYDFMYWSQVVRPGSQIDRNLNQSQSTLFGGGTLVGQASPAPQSNRSDFWAQGVTFGIEFRY